MGRDGRTHEGVVLAEERGPLGLCQRVGEPGGPFDVREEERDRAGRENHATNLAVSMARGQFRWRARSATLRPT
jgi:hypothetical protein